MLKKVIFPKASLGRYRLILLLLVPIFFRGNVALAINFNLDFYPQGQVLDTEFSPPYNYLSDCSVGQGRFFEFTSGRSFRLSGLALFFFRETTGNVNSIFRTSDLKVSLFEGSGASPSKALIFRAGPSLVHPSHNTILSLFGNGEARGLFFDIGSLWLEKNKTYTILLECQNVLPEVQKLYATSSYSGARSFDSLAFGPADENIYKKPYFQLYYRNDGLALISPVKTLPLLRPVILVHGLGGNPADFSQIVDLLKASGWPSSYLLSFDYGLKNNVYNSYPDLKDLTKRLNLAVSTVSAQFRAAGGDGKVDLIAYSAGALVARNYLAEFKGSQSLRRLVALGGTFKGSFLTDLEKGNERFPGVGVTLPLRLAKIFLNPLISLNLLTMGRASEDDSFKAQLVDDSSVVRLYKKEDLPAEVGYYGLTGDIKVKEVQKLFNLSIVSQGSLGDGAVLGESGNDLNNPSVFTFSEISVATRSVTRGTATVSALLKLPDLTKLKFLHSNLFKADEIKNKDLYIILN